MQTLTEACFVFVWGMIGEWVDYGRMGMLEGRHANHWLQVFPKLKDQWQKYCRSRIARGLSHRLFGLVMDSQCGTPCSGRPGLRTEVISEVPAEVWRFCFDGL